MKPYKGWTITIKRGFFGQKKFIAAKNNQEFVAMTLKRLKLKINAHLMMPQILDKPSNFV